MIDKILSSSLVLLVVDDELVIRGPSGEISVLMPELKQWKPELLKIIAGETVDDVGACGHCGSALIGLSVFDGYVNRVCPACGTWHRCLEPPAIPARPVCVEPAMSLFLETAASPEPAGNLQ